MKKYYTILLLLLTFLTAFSQELYVKTYGMENAKPIVFLHGGPGYNASNFEFTTAQKLADTGYFVIVYDRRGEGRSKDPNAKFTFEETFNDMNTILDKYNIKKASFIGHSFGGIVAVKYAEKYPAKVNTVVLVGAPVSLQESFTTIINHARQIYTEKNDTTSLGYVSMLEKMDKNSMEYASYTFMHAMQNGFYSPKEPTTEAKAINAGFRNNPEAKLASQMTREAPMGFWKNENYTTLDLTAAIQDLVSKKMKIIGLYGKEDGLYSETQVKNLEKIIGKDNLLYLGNCAHNVFTDQQQAFLENIKSHI